MERARAAVVFAALTLGAGCSRASQGTAGADTRPEGQALGEVMAQVGRRFELVGRAGVAGRYELADFEVGELSELFEDDVPRASLPKEGPTAHIPGMAEAFLKIAVPDLRQAVAKKDQAALAEAFQRTATLCNGCHRASAKGFIEVPTVPGRGVPALDPAPTAP